MWIFCLHLRVHMIRLARASSFLLDLKLCLALGQCPVKKVNVWWRAIQKRVVAIKGGSYLARARRGNHNHSCRKWFVRSDSVLFISAGIKSRRSIQLTAHVVGVFWSATRAADAGGFWRMLALFLNLIYNAGCWRHDRNRKLMHWFYWFCRNSSLSRMVKHVLKDLVVPVHFQAIFVAAKGD